MSFVIAVEGLDGTGKSTLAALVAKELRSLNSWVYQTKEPGNAVVMNGVKFNRPGPDLRGLVLGEASLTPMERELLFYVDASMHRRFIENQGDAVIISDRGLWSHLAYLRATLKTGQMDYTEYALCKNLVNQVCRQPDAIVYLQGDLALMSERLAGKPKDVIESNSSDFFAKVLETYEDLYEDSKRQNQKVLQLQARSTVTQNVTDVVKWLKGAFDDKQFGNGNTAVC